MTTPPPPPPNPQTSPSGSAPRRPCPDAAKTTSCQECVDFLLDYIDGRLPPDQVFKLESHLAFCGDCEVFVENYRKAATLARSAASPAPVNTQVPVGLVEAILAARKAGR